MATLTLFLALGYLTLLISNLHPGLESGRASSHEADV